MVWHWDFTPGTRPGRPRRSTWTSQRGNKLCLDRSELPSDRQTSALQQVLYIVLDKLGCSLISTCGAKVGEVANWQINPKKPPPHAPRAWESSQGRVGAWSSCRVKLDCAWKSSGSLIYRSIELVDAW
ncbi:hypothetical protein NXS19_009342 [Fusarium pseudograminearum]|nr:hypothetical protein NXS19_009342 [Fusarium pseudograminearum]